MSIELHQVSKEFGGVAAVRGVSFRVNDGELVALLGPSGGGKTTVLRMIAGLEAPTAGDIYIRGQRSTISRSRNATLASCSRTTRCSGA